MTIKELIEELEKYPGNYTVELRGRYYVDSLRDAGKCSISLESDSLDDQFKYYEECRDELRGACNNTNKVKEFAPIPNTIWHYYPKEKPAKDGEYVVRYWLGDGPALTMRKFENGEFTTYGWERIEQWAEN